MCKIPVEDWDQQGSTFVNGLDWHPGRWYIMRYVSSCCAGIHPKLAGYSIFLCESWIHQHQKNMVQLPFSQGAMDGRYWYTELHVKYARSVRRFFKTSRQLTVVASSQPDRRATWIHVISMWNPTVECNSWEWNLMKWFKVQKRLCIQ